MPYTRQYNTTKWSWSVPTTADNPTPQPVRNRQSSKTVISISILTMACSALCLLQCPWACWVRCRKDCIKTGRPVHSATSWKATVGLTFWNGLRKCWVRPSLELAALILIGRQLGLRKFSIACGLACLGQYNTTKYLCSGMSEHITVDHIPLPLPVREAAVLQGLAFPFCIQVTTHTVL
jgi:hypothetical protein